MAQSMIEFIKILRERTGAGMMDCKKALEENEMDLEKACEWLREKGIAKAAKKSGRIAAEGMSSVLIKGNEAIILEINSETDFVAKSDSFKALVEEIAAVVLEKKPECINCAKDLTAEIFTNATVKIGEKLDFRRFEIVTKTDAQSFGGYIHMGGKISSLILLNGNAGEAAEGLAMHIAANNPLYVSTTDIPKEEVERETNVQLEISKQDPKLADKPEAMLRNIIQGKVSKFFADSVFLEQEYLLEPGVKVAKFLSSHNLSIVKMVRYATGEGIEKRSENFAEEVAKQIG